MKNNNVFKIMVIFYDFYVVRKFFYLLDLSNIFCFELLYEFGIFF